MLAGSASAEIASAVSKFETVPLERVDADMSLAQGRESRSRAFAVRLDSGTPYRRARHGARRACSRFALDRRSAIFFARRTLHSALASGSPRLDRRHPFDGNFSLTKAGVNPYLKGIDHRDRRALYRSRRSIDLASGFPAKEARRRVRPTRFPACPRRCRAARWPYAGKASTAVISIRVSSVPIAAATPSGLRASDPST